MAIERTLSIIKPDAVAKNVIGQIYARFEAAGLKVIAARMAHLSRGEAEQFYAVHKARPFFKDLVDFMVSGPVMIQVLEGENAILKNRDLMGATNPKEDWNCHAWHLDRLVRPPKGTNGYATAPGRTWCIISRETTLGQLPRT